MHPIKRLLFTELRKQDEEMGPMNDDEMNLVNFHWSDSLRLSLTGFILVKKLFTAYSFKIPKDMKSRHRQAMSKMEYPYFLTGSRLILFSEMDAMIIKLHGGIEGFLETYSSLD
jgi:hypothetical protein